MMSKIITGILLTLSLGCNLNKEVSISSKYETVYSKTINEKQFDLIHQILKDNILDFPVSKKNKLSYKSGNNNYILKIYLKKDYFKLVFRSNVGYDKKITMIKSKIEAIK